MTIPLSQRAFSLKRLHSSFAVVTFRDGSIANKDKHGKQQTPNKQLQELKPKALVTRILIARVKQAYKVY